jgi:hypothetical protein
MLEVADYFTLGRLYSMKPIRVTHIRALSWRQRLVTYAAVFGTLWLFLEPVAALLFGQRSSELTGKMFFIGLVAGATLITIGIEISIRNRLKGRLIFVEFIVIFTATGEEYLVEAPKSMRVYTFLETFVPLIAKDSPETTFLANHSMYDWRLFPSKGERRRPLNNDQTISEAGLNTSSPVELHAKIKSHGVTLGGSDFEWD